MKMFNRILGATFTFAMLATTAVHAADPTKFEVDPKQSPVTFLAVGKPGFLRIKGEGASLKGTAEVKDGQVTGLFKVGLGDLKTGIDLRDEHMKERYLDVAHFPEALLKIENMKATLTGTEKTEFTGTFTVKGKTGPVKGTVELETASGRSSVKGNAKFSISLTQFDVGIPSHLGVKVAEDVEISVAFVATPSGSAAHM